MLFCVGPCIMCIFYKCVYKKCTKRSGEYKLCTKYPEVFIAYLTFFSENVHGCCSCPQCNDVYEDRDERPIIVRTVHGRGYDIHFI